MYCHHVIGPADVRGRVADEGGRHLETTRGNITAHLASQYIRTVRGTGSNVPLGSRDVSGDPLDKEGRVLGLHILDLLLDLLHRDLTTVDTVDGEVALFRQFITFPR